MTIHDNHSLNKTFRSGTQLKPDVHYALEGGETITLGEVEMKFELVEKQNKEEEEENYLAPTQLMESRNGESNEDSLNDSKVVF